jgi:hypothetical protein
MSKPRVVGHIPHVVVIVILEVYMLEMGLVFFIKVVEKIF